MKEKKSEKEEKKGKKEDRIRVRGRGARREERMLGGVAKQEPDGPRQSHRPLGPRLTPFSRTYL